MSEGKRVHYCKTVRVVSGRVSVTRITDDPVSWPVHADMFGGQRHDMREDHKFRLKKCSLQQRRKTGKAAGGMNQPAAGWGVVLQLMVREADLSDATTTYDGRSASQGKLILLAWFLTRGILTQSDCTRGRGV